LYAMVAGASVHLSLVNSRWRFHFFIPSGIAVAGEKTLIVRQVAYDGRRPGLYLVNGCVIVSLAHSFPSLRSPAFLRFGSIIRRAPIRYLAPFARSFSLTRFRPSAKASFKPGNECVTSLRQCARESHGKWSARNLLLSWNRGCVPGNFGSSRFIFRCRRN